MEVGKRGGSHTTANKTQTYNSFNMQLNECQNVGGDSWWGGILEICPTTHLPCVLEESQRGPVAYPPNMAKLKRITLIIYFYFTTSSSSIISRTAMLSINDVIVISLRIKEHPLVNVPKAKLNIIKEYLIM